MAHSSIAGIAGGETGTCGSANVTPPDSVEAGSTALAPLRDYQRRAVDEATQALAESGSCLFVCPTGGGKTFVLAELAKRQRAHGRVLYISDREHLIHQTAGMMEERSGLSIGIEQGDARVSRRRLPDITCATIQSLRQKNRLEDFKRNSFSTILLDEADLSVAESYQVVLDYFVGAKVFGCTATPDRADQKSLSPNFAKTITEVGIADLIGRGFLAPISRHLVRIKSVDLSPLRSRNGDFSDVDIQRVFADEKALHEVACPAIELAGARPTLVFAATVRHAQRLADVFNRYRHGKAAAIHGKMSTEERRDILSRFESGALQYLCSCALLLRGVDLPFVSCVAMARPTKSRALYCQSMGRGTRVCDGKADLLVLDYTDNSLCHDLVCAIDALAPESPEVRQHARDILDGNPGGNPQDAIEQARDELAKDHELRAQVSAKVLFYTREVISIDWSKQPLGQMADRIIAESLGVSAATVQKIRTARKIAPHTPWARKNIDWDGQPLGTMSDQNLAAQLGCAKGTVSRERNRRGIERFGLTLTPGRKVDWGAQPIGKVTDAELASRLGMTKASITATRKRLKIPAFESHAATWKAIDWLSQPLGKKTDREVASVLNVPLWVIRKKRKDLGIAPFSHRYKARAQTEDRPIRRCRTSARTAGGSTSR